MNIRDTFTGEKIKVWKWGESFPGPARRRLHYLSTTLSLMEVTQQVGDYNEQKNQLIAEKAVNNLVSTDSRHGSTSNTSTRLNMKIKYTAQPVEIKSMSAEDTTAPGTLDPVINNATNGNTHVEYSRQLVDAAYRSKPSVEQRPQEQGRA